MKILISVISILLFATSSYAQTYTVERAIDGDTIKLTNGEEVQLIGIKAPEDETMGKVTTEYVKSWEIEGKEVCIEFDVEKKDKNNRLLAYMYFNVFYSSKAAGITMNVFQYPLSNCDTHKGVVWSQLNSLLVNQGYATPMTIPPNVKYADLFKELYEEARKQGRGLWATESALDVVMKYNQTLPSLEVRKYLTGFMLDEYDSMVEQYSKKEMKRLLLVNKMIIHDIQNMRMEKVSDDYVLIKIHDFEFFNGEQNPFSIEFPFVYGVEKVNNEWKIRISRYGLAGDSINSFIKDITFY